MEKVYVEDFIDLFDRQRSQVGREAGREREGETVSPLEQRARYGPQSQDPEIMTQAEGRGFNSPSHPGTREGKL